MAEPTRQGPLSHIRVLDLGRIMAAPWATQMFADLGAEVIKIERPGSGDDTRGWGPPFLNDETGNQTRESGYYLSVNRGKQSIALDISRPEGQEIVRNLAGECDIVIENFKAGALEKYGLDAASLRAINPALIYCSVTGFGQDGPARDNAAYDFAIQAMGGLMSVTGERDGEPGGGPQKVGIPIIDLMTGMYAAVAILAALSHREQTGQGETIDLAMFDVASAILANQAMNYLISGKTPQRKGNRHPNIQPQDLFSCADGDFVLAVGNDGQFAKLCEVLGMAELSADERFATNGARVDNHDALDAILKPAFARYTREELTGALGKAGVPCAAINGIDEVFEHPQLRHRRMLRHLSHPLSGQVPQVVSPMNFADAPLDFSQAPPLLGEHGDKILADLGVSEAARAELREKGVLGE